LLALAAAAAAWQLLLRAAGALCAPQRGGARLLPRHTFHSRGDRLFELGFCAWPAFWHRLVDLLRLLLLLLLQLLLLRHAFCHRLVELLRLLLLLLQLLLLLLLLLLFQLLLLQLLQLLFQLLQLHMLLLLRLLLMVQLLLLRLPLLLLQDARRDDARRDDPRRNNMSLACAARNRRAARRQQRVAAVGCWRSRWPREYLAARRSTGLGILDVKSVVEAGREPPPIDCLQGKITTHHSRIMV
jgi:hypothetical protein